MLQLCNVQAMHPTSTVMHSVGDEALVHTASHTHQLVSPVQLWYFSQQHMCTCQPQHRRNQVRGCEGSQLNLAVHQLPWSRPAVVYCFQVAPLHSHPTTAEDWVLQCCHRHKSASIQWWCCHCWPSPQLWGQWTQPAVDVVGCQISRMSSCMVQPVQHWPEVLQ